MRIILIAGMFLVFVSGWMPVAGQVQFYDSQKVSQIPLYSYKELGKEELNLFLLNRAKSKKIHQMEFMFVHDSIFEYYSTEKYQLALESLCSWESILTATADTAGIDYATVMHDLGTIYYCQGRLQEALKHFNRVLSISSEHENMGKIRNNATLQIQYAWSDLRNEFRSMTYTSRIIGGINNMDEQQESHFYFQDYTDVYEKRGNGTLVANLRYESKLYREIFQKTKNPIVEMFSQRTALAANSIEVMQNSIPETFNEDVAEVFNNWNHINNIKIKNKRYYIFGYLLADWLIRLNRFKEGLKILADMEREIVHISPLRRKYVTGQYQTHFLLVRTLSAIAYSRTNQQEKAKKILRNLKQEISREADSEQFPMRNAFIFTNLSMCSLELYKNRNNGSEQSDSLASIEFALELMFRSMASFQAAMHSTNNYEERLFISRSFTESFGHGMDIAYQGYLNSSTEDERQLFVKVALGLSHKYLNRAHQSEMINTDLPNQLASLKVAPLLKRYRKINGEIRALSHQLAHASISSMLNRSEKRLYQLYAEEDKVLSEIHHHHPGFNPRGQNIPFSINQKSNIFDRLKAKLQPNEAAIFYFENVSGFYRITIWGDSLEFDKIRKEEETRKLVAETGYFEKQISHLSNNKLPLSKSDSVNHNLCNLIWPFRPNMDHLPQKVWIFPTGEFYRIPFDGLKYSLSDSLIKDDYLVFHHEIVLHSNPELWLNERRIENEKTSEEKYTSLVICPGYEPVDAEQDTLFDAYKKCRPLREIAKLGEDFSKNYGFESFVGPETRKSELFAKVQKAGIIYFGTHGFGELDNPYNSTIQLYPDYTLNDNGILNTFEVFDLKMQSELVILGGCRSGIGRHSFGNGLMSMARAFMKAGSRSVLMSLWDVDEEYSAQLHKSFLQKLYEGKTKSLALRETKIEFIKNAKNPHLRSPYYWASFQLIGDDRSLPPSILIQPKSSLKLWLMAILTVLIVLFLLLNIGPTKYRLKRFF